MNESFTCDRCNGKGVMRFEDTDTLDYCLWCSGTGKLNWLNKLFGKKWDNSMCSGQPHLRGLNLSKYYNTRDKKMEQK